MIVREVRNIAFESLREEGDRFQVVEGITGKVTALVEQCPFLFGEFGKYLRDDFKETSKLFKVTAYCFLAEKHSFNINEFYCEAFDFGEAEGPPRKKQKPS